MSRNFELLTNLVEERDLFGSVEEKSRPSVSRPSTSDESANSVTRLPGEAHEEVAKLAQRVFVMNEKGASSRAIAFCGVEHGDGTSWICAQVARVIAELYEARVCAVDVNLTSPALHRCFGLPNRRGLSELVSKRGPVREFLEQDRLRNLSVLTVGSGANPELILSSPQFRERLAELRSEFDYVIFDAPPVSHSNNAAVLGRLIDGVVLVIGAHTTRREAARRAKEALEKGQVQLLGTVLNGRTFPIPKSLYQRL